MIFGTLFSFLETLAVAAVVLIALPSHASSTDIAQQQTLNLDSHSFLLTGGASFIAGHGAPTGVSLRTGSPGQRTAASFPSNAVIAPNTTITGIDFSYRYICGYGAAGEGHGANLSLAVTDDPVRVLNGAVLYASPHYTDYSYAANNSNYSKPVVVSLKGLKVQGSTALTTRLQLAFYNNDRNLQILVPIGMNVTCESSSHFSSANSSSGVSGGNCFVIPPPKPTPPPPAPVPPTPPPPKSSTPWDNVGPKNIGDDIHNAGEAGTIAGAVSPLSNPKLMYMGGVNNAASSGVLKTTNGGAHWSKMNTGLWDTRPHGLYIVDDAGQHVLVGTDSGVFESVDGAQTWTHVDATQGWGVANSFRNGTINSKPVIFVGANGGLGNVFVEDRNSLKPLVNSTWSIIRSPPGSAAWRTNVVSVADFDADGKPLENSVLVGCLWVGGHGVLHRLTVINETTADWDVRVDQPCQAAAMDPNNANHMIVNNASNGLHLYETKDAGKSFQSCLDYRGAVMVAIDRRGWFYGASEGGAFRNVGGDCSASGKWEPYFVRRIARRTGGIRDRSAHDYQRINIDFQGRVAFGSDQGMFYQNPLNDTTLQFISANGDVNNNIIMHPAIAKNADTPGEVCITTALWDWSPVASWDSGKHWPSWQTPDDGNAMGYFGEGGGCFGVGESKYSLCMHHHNVAFSSRCGKNMSRLVVPYGASVGGPTHMMAEGSRSVPAGPVFALMTMGAPPYETKQDMLLDCTSNASLFGGDLGIHNTSGQCLSHMVLGLEYGRYPGVNAAVWRGATDKHCVLCRIPDKNSSDWPIKPAKGYTTIIPVAAGSGDGAFFESNGDGQIEVVRDGDEEEEEEEEEDEMDSAMRFVEKMRKLEQGGSYEQFSSKWPVSLLGRDDASALDALNGNPKYVLKSWNFGANWTWVMLPDYLQGMGSFAVDPTNATGILYGITTSCVARSYDQAETWSDCWEPSPDLTGSFRSLVIRDSLTMIMVRNGDVPLRSLDGGKSWKPLNSLVNIAKAGLTVQYSWSGKTLAVSTIIDQTVVWVSTDDGDTWVDESADYTAMSGGIAQWYDNTLYISSMGQGIVSKTFKE